MLDFFKGKNRHKLEDNIYEDNNVKTHPQSPEQLASQFAYQLFTNNVFSSIFDGDKFPGGFGLTKGYEFVDYWTLRERSVQLFTENLYAAGLINRLVTNIINTGLTLEATPNGDILGLDDDFINDWSENVENLHRIWGNNKDLVDWKRQNTEGELQRIAKKTALISGDCLVVMRQSSATGLPVTELIDGRHIKNPAEPKLKKSAIARGNRIIHGVELDANDRHIAFYVSINKNGKVRSERIPAQGPKSKRKIAWLLYGTKRLLDDVRGIPLLGLIAQSLKEIDRYRDSEQRAAVVNSMIALFIKKTSDKIGTHPLSGSALRKDTKTVTDGDGGTRDFKINNWLPGMGIDELAKGEEPQGFDTKRPNINFTVFEDTILSTIAWTYGIPPETLKLQYQNNFSASRMASSEFKILLDMERSSFSSGFCKPRYSNWLISMTLTDRIQAPGLLESARDIRQFHIYGAWIDSDWAGMIKPHVDPLKEVNSHVIKNKEAYSTRDRSTKELTGTKFSRNVRQLKKENEQLAEAHKPLIDAGLMKTQSVNLVNDQKTELMAVLGDIIQEKIEETMEMIN